MSLKVIVLTYLENFGGIADLEGVGVKQLVSLEVFLVSKFCC